MPSLLSRTCATCTNESGAGGEIAAGETRPLLTDSERFLGISLDRSLMLPERLGLGEKATRPSLSSATAQYNVSVGILTFGR